VTVGEGVAKPRAGRTIPAWPPACTKS
jgi:hypothetical protein